MKFRTFVLVAIGFLVSSWIVSTVEIRGILNRLDLIEHAIGIQR